MDIESSFENALDSIVGFLPNLLGFLLILLVGYIIARVVATLVGKVLEKLGVDRQLQSSSAHSYVDRVLPGASPSRGVAKLVFWLIFVFFIFAAIGALGIAGVTAFMNDVLGYLPNVIAAVAIFIVAALLAGAAAAGVARFMGDTPTGKIVGTIVPALVMVIAMFMILEQLQIAPEIVRIAFAATMGALALGLALAFGLGGRPVAQEMLENAYRKGLEEREQVRRDLETGRQRATHAASPSPAHSSGEYADHGYAAAPPPPTTAGQGAGYDAGGYQAAPGATPGADPNATQQWPAPESPQAPQAPQPPQQGAPDLYGEQPPR